MKIQVALLLCAGALLPGCAAALTGTRVLPAWNMFKAGQSLTGGNVTAELEPDAGWILPGARGEIRSVAVVAGCASAPRIAELLEEFGTWRVVTPSEVQRRAGAGRAVPSSFMTTSERTLALRDLAASLGVDAALAIEEGGGGASMNHWSLDRMQIRRVFEAQLVTASLDRAVWRCRGALVHRTGANTPADSEFVEAQAIAVIESLLGLEES